MRAWREVIQRWVAQEPGIASRALPGASNAEYQIWMIHPPSSAPWPSQLPTCQALQDFYRLCDGGYFNGFLWSSLARLDELNQHWVGLLSDWDERGDALLPGRHVVFALDSGGCPVVWDTTTDQVKAFQWDGGDWEPPLASSVEAFLGDLFNPTDEQYNGPWRHFLHWLENL